MLQIKKAVAAISFITLTGTAMAQAPGSDSLLQEATLPNIIQYALKHQPAINQALVDEKITETTIRTKLADWYPQLSFNYLLQHNFQVQTNIIGGNPVRLGVSNTSAGQFGLSQVLFNRDVFLANRTKLDVRLQARQNTTASKIDVVAMASKAFYDVLTTMQQIKVTDENIARLQRSLKDATARYNAGIVDKTDYKRATILLNNSQATKRGAEAALKGQVEYLKAIINYPETAPLQIAFDSLQIEKDMLLDTLQQVDIKNRIEYQQLETQKRLLEYNLKYEKLGYAPTLGLNAAYNMNFQNDQFSKLYGTIYPQSYAGLTLSVPIFQGFKRKYKIEAAQLQIQRNDLAMVSLKNSVSAEYARALASYQSNMANYLALKENVDLAREVYDVIQLQYKAGIKTYLEVVTAETDLRTSQINYFNALNALMLAKIDVQQALGQITY